MTIAEENLNETPVKSLWKAPISHIPATDQNTVAKFGEDSNLIVEFRNVFVRDELRTLEAGKSVGEDVEFVKIRVPGDKTFVYDQPSTLRDRARFPHQYAAFKENRVEIIDGIPLEAWDYQLSPSAIGTCHILGIKYVHQLASMDDVHIHSLGLEGPSMVKMARIATAEYEANKIDSVRSKMQEEINRANENNFELMNLLERKDRENKEFQDKLLKEFEAIKLGNKKNVKKSKKIIRTKSRSSSRIAA